MLCIAQCYAQHQRHSIDAEPQPAALTSQEGASIISDSDSVTEGPLKVYLDGRKSGLYRPDPRQETTIKLLQNLYEELKKLHVDHKRPSGLTTTDHIGSDNKPRHSWYLSTFCLIYSSCSGFQSFMSGLQLTSHMTECMCTLLATHMVLNSVPLLAMLSLLLS